MQRTHARWAPGTESKLQSICPRRLYSRLHPEISARTARAMTRSRVAADGFKNIVLQKIMRGFGGRGHKTREYRFGEAADLVRYILRELGLEEDINAGFSNVIELEGEHSLPEAAMEQRVAQLVGFWSALEAFEAEVEPSGNVYSHLILAMPHELSSEGRERALEDFCANLDELNLPFTAALHKPDPQGDIRNFHAHIMMATRPFAIEGPFAWSFEAAKATEFNLAPGIAWLRERAAEAFNRALEEEHNPLRYSGLSQAKRGVPATGETHDGPALTARKRKSQEDQAERDRLLQGLAVHVVRAAGRQASLGAQIENAAAARVSVPATAPEVPAEVQASALEQAELPAALAALRERFPNPLRLRGLSAPAFEDFTAADWAADRWYSPAFNMRVDLQRDPDGMVRDRNGEPDLIEENLKPEYRALLDAPALPDIVQEALLEAHQRIVREWERKKRIAREKEEVRQERLAWLEKNRPVLLFDEKYRVLPEYLALFPPEVVALDGVRKAMSECHYAAQQERNRRIKEKPKAAQTPSRFDPDAGMQPSTPSAQVTPSIAPAATTQTQAEPAAEPGAAQHPAPQQAEDEDWNRLLQGVQSGKVSLPGKGGTGIG